MKRLVLAAVVALLATSGQMVPASATVPEPIPVPQLGVPDYIDPLLLTDLRRQLDRADAAVTAAETHISNQRGVVAAAERRLRLAEVTASRSERAARAAQLRLSYAVHAGYTGRSSALSPALQVWTAPDEDAAAAAISNAALLDRVLAAQARQGRSAAGRAAAATASAAATRRTAQLARQHLEALRKTSQHARALAVAARARLAARVEEIRADLAHRRAVERNRAGGFAATWSAYVAQVTQLTRPLSATALRDPAHLPDGYSPVLDAGGDPQPGVAQVRAGSGWLLVLPREVMAAVAYAIDHLSAPYVWGAVGPDTFDCSGLTQSAYQGGIPRVAADQYAWTPPVPAGDELPGDLVFFVGSEGTTARPGHVGMVVDPARHLMIQAPQSGDVVKVSDYADWGGLIGFGRPSLRN